MITLWTHTPEYVLAVVTPGHLVVRLQPQVVPEDVLLAVLRHQPTLEALLPTDEVVHLIDRTARVGSRHEKPLQHRRQGRTQGQLLWALFRGFLLDFLPRNWVNVNVN